jgi:long-chain acyl-CoA synthetase
MTECSPRITSASLKEPTKGDEVGHIVKRCEVKVVDGEIWAKSPSVMLGYYENEEATKEILTEDGWLKTGDLGYVEGNLVYLTGRKKNLIILSNGENISPEELENKFANLEWLQEILVYSEDEKITAEVYPFPEFKDQAEELFKQKVAEINKTVPPSKRIMRMRLRDNEFVKTTSKKVKRIQPGEKGRLI